MPGLVKLLQVFVLIVAGLVLGIVITIAFRLSGIGF